jgi:N-acetyl-anhydromuramyl-L-alanine amidase AmpD
MNPANQVSYHFVISHEGEVVQAVDIANTAWANGTTNNGDNRCNSRSTLAAVRDRRVNANLYTISIGFGGMPAGNPTPVQLAAAVELIKHISAETKRLFGQPIPFTRQNIVGHNEITPITRPNCPGRAFPFDEIINMLNSAEEAEEKGAANMQEQRFQDINSIPDWARPTIKKLIDFCECRNLPRGVLHGNNKDGTSLDLSLDMIRILVILDRLGLFEIMVMLERKGIFDNGRD